MRLLILFRNMKNEFSRLIHPRAVLPVKVNQQALSFYYLYCKYFYFTVFDLYFCRLGSFNVYGT